MYRRFKCEKCGNIFISKAKDGYNLRCRNGEKQGCGSTLVSFIENINITKKEGEKISRDLDFINNNSGVVEEDEDINYTCGNCGYEKIKKGDLHCPNCGDELNWNNENNSWW